MKTFEAYGILGAFDNWTADLLASGSSKPDLLHRRLLICNLMDFDNVAIRVIEKNHASNRQLLFHPSLKREYRSSRGVS